MRHLEFLPFAVGRSFPDWFIQLDLSLDTARQRVEYRHRTFRRKGVGDLIVTMGSKGSLICDGENAAFVKAHKVEAVDTTGAGDCYCGALCVALSEGASLIEAAEFATKASAIAVQRPGAQNAMPYRKEITI